MGNVEFLISQYADDTSFILDVFLSLLIIASKFCKQKTTFPSDLHAM